MTDQEFPQAEPGDADEVVLALTTAGSLWSGGEQAEAIRWLRKAQEAADAAGSDERSLALARAAADLTEAGQEGETAEQPVFEQGNKPQLTKPPMPPASPKTRLETPNAKAAEGGTPPSSSAQTAENGAVLTQVLRVCIKRSVRDEKLLVARLLDDGGVPAGYQEALVVLTDPSQDVLDKLS